MTQDLYQEVILEEYANPKNNGQLPDADVKVSKTNASCGDEVEVFVKFDSSREKIEKVSWWGVGCAISVAAASLVSEQITGKTRSEVISLQQHDVEEMLGIEEISPGRRKCLLLALSAFQQAAELSNDQQ